MADGGTAKTCLGGGMHCPSASSFFYYYGRPTLYFHVVVCSSSFFHRLISAVTDSMSTILLHMVWP